MKILIICTGNSCRSQIAEGYLRYYLKDKAEIFSAGLRPEPVNPFAITAMKEAGIDISRHVSNSIEQYIDDKFDYVITVCDNANEHCPIFPGNAKRIHKNFSDPAKARGEYDEVLAIYRSVRDEIKEFCLNFAKSEL